MADNETEAEQPSVEQLIADGATVLTVSRDGTIRSWTTISHESLMSEVRATSRFCLPRDFHVNYLLRDEKEAADRFEACAAGISGPGDGGPV